MNIWLITFPAVGIFLVGLFVFAWWSNKDFDIQNDAIFSNATLAENKYLADHGYTFKNDRYLTVDQKLEILRQQINDSADYYRVYNDIQNMNHYASCKSANNLWPGLDKTIILDSWGCKAQ